MDSGDDSLVGLRFEVSGGLGRMSGRIVGKAGALYLVRKDGAEYLELLALDDLRPAKFYADAPVERPAPAAVQDKASDAAVTTPDPAKSGKRLSEQIRRHLNRGS